MENNGARRCVAIIERCAMSEAGLRYLLPTTGNYQFCFFKDYAAFLKALAWTPFFSLIYSLSAIRTQRLECLKVMYDMEQTRLHQQRIVLAGNDMEARLVGHFSPAPLHGIISKTASLERVRQQLQRWLSDERGVNENILSTWYYRYERELNQNEREILYYTALGYSLAHIAALTGRNGKSIRMHKLSLMAKLGVKTDASLFYAADVLVQMQQTLGTKPARQRQISA